MSTDDSIVVVEDKTKYYNPLTFIFIEKEDGFYCYGEDREFSWMEDGIQKNLGFSIYEEKSEHSNMEAFKHHVLNKKMDDTYKSFRASYDLQHKINEGLDLKTIALRLQFSNNSLWDEVCNYRLQIKEGK